MSDNSKPASGCTCPNCCSDVSPEMIDALRGALCDNPCVVIDKDDGGGRYYFSDPDLSRAIHRVFAASNCPNIARGSVARVYEANKAIADATAEMCKSEVILPNAVRTNIGRAANLLAMWCLLNKPPLEN